jgi:CheY-like chemotaxis protein
MARQILWLDNDIYYIRPYVEALHLEGYDVMVVGTVSDADVSLEEHSYELFILDAMIPTKDEREEATYPPEETENGHKTGLVFYRRRKQKLNQAGTRVLVLTVRIDEDIAEQFISDGLPKECFATKFNLRETGAFLSRVKSLLPAARGLE